jgi:hypothetical protein
MSKGWTFAASVAGACGIGACALITHFDPAVTPDGGGDGGCPSTALLCEDFENGSMDGKWSRQPQAGGEWDIDSRPSPVHLGQHSLHLHADEPPDGSTSETEVAWELSIQGSWNFPLYLRAFVYWTNPLATQVANFLQLQKLDRSAGFVLYAGRSQLGWTDWGDNVTRGLSTPPSTGAWTCVEWQFNGTGGTDVEVLLDGKQNSSLGDPNTPIFRFSELDVGLLVGTTGGEPPMDLYVDDLVLANSPIGCGP